MAKARPKAVVAINLGIGERSRFDSAEEAEKEPGMHRSGISMILNGEIKQTKGYRFVWG